MNSTNISYMPIWSKYRALFQDSGLTYAEIGQLVCAMMDYHFTDREPVDLPSSIKYCWFLMKPDLDFAKKSYLTAVNNGKKGGRPKKKPEETQQNPEKPITKQIKTNHNNTIQDKYTRSAPSLPEVREGICVEKQPFGEYGWVKLKPEQYQKLVKEWGAEELTRCITYVDEAAQSTNNKNRWKDWYLMLRRCHRDHWHREPAKDAIPKGASGILGEAELEAIQRVLWE